MTTINFEKIIKELGCYLIASIIELVVFIGWMEGWEDLLRVSFSKFLSSLILAPLLPLATLVKLFDRPSLIFAISFLVFLASFIALRILYDVIQKRHAVKN